MWHSEIYEILSRYIFEVFIWAKYREFNDTLVQNLKFLQAIDDNFLVER